MKSRRRGPGKSPHPRAVRAAVRALDRARAPLFRELERLLRDPDYLRGEPAHASCIRPRNRMRISPLEAEAIRAALLDRPELRRRLPEIRRRLRRELRKLDDSTARQGFDCPLLERKLCLVHGTAKPIGCLAWHPGRGFTDEGWLGFARRDSLNDQLLGERWKLRVIPLWLARVLGEPLPGRRPRKLSGRFRKCGDAPRATRRRARKGERRAVRSRERSEGRSEQCGASTPEEAGTAKRSPPRAARRRRACPPTGGRAPAKRVALPDF